MEKEHEEKASVIEQEATEVENQVSETEEQPVEALESSSDSAVQEAKEVEGLEEPTEGSEPVITEEVAGVAPEESAQMAAYADVVIQPELDQKRIKTKWNWGAFSFTMWFGIAHRAYLGLLILLGFIPWLGWIFAIVWMIVFGLNGEKWALENSPHAYRDEEEFRKVMDGWNRSGLVAFIIGATVLVLTIIFLSVLLTVLFNNMDIIENEFNRNYHQFNNY